jgi:hypothetical protein
VSSEYFGRKCQLGSAVVYVPSYLFVRDVLVVFFLILVLLSLTKLFGQRYYFPCILWTFLVR